MRAYSKEKKVGFSFKVCLRWQHDLGLRSSRFCGPGGWSANPLLHTYDTRWTLPTGAGSAAPVRTPHLEGFAPWGPKTPSSILWSGVQQGSKRSQLPMTLMVKTLMDFLGQVDELFEWQQLPRFQQQTTTLSRPAVKPLLKYLAIWCGWERPKESDEAVHERAGTRVTCSTGERRAPAGPQGMRHGTHWRGGDKTKT